MVSSIFTYNHLLVYAAPGTNPSFTGNTGCDISMLNMLSEVLYELSGSKNVMFPQIRGCVMFGTSPETRVQL